MIETYTPPRLHTPTTVNLKRLQGYAPFELVLSTPPGPLALQAQQSEPSTYRNFQEQWKDWLSKALQEAASHLRSAQERFKRNYDKRLRRNAEIISQGDFVFLRSEKKSEKESRQKLAPIALGPYLAKQVDDKAKTAVIVYDDNTVENLPRSRIVLAPKQLSSAELQSIVQPTIFNRTIANYPATEDENRKHVLSKDDVSANEEIIGEKMHELPLKVHKTTRAWTKLASKATNFSSTL